MNTHIHHQIQKYFNRALSLTFFLLFVFCAQISVVNAAVQIGKTEFSRGAVSVQGEDNSVRIIGQDSAIYQGDVISTGEKSFAIISLNDGSRMSLRPNTVFSVEEFSTKAQQESAVMRLFKGGVRTITGFISKRNSNAYQLKTSVATIGIRGTEFDARLCEEDCKQESEKYKQAQTIISSVVGRVAFIKGQLTGINAEGYSRTIVKGGPLYQGDSLITGAASFAVLALRDEGRITLQAETEFKIEKLEYQAASPETSSAVFRLVKGGIRALTGLIGKKNPNAYQVATPVATIGIRGTGFDLQCQGACVSGASAQNGPEIMEGVKADSIGLQLLHKIIPQAFAAAPQGDGLFASVWNGTIIVKLASGDLILDQGKTIFLPNNNSEPVFLPVLPLFMQQSPAPRPDGVEVDHGGLFGVETTNNMEPGLYVSVYEGHIAMQQGNSVIDLGAGEAGYSNAGGAKLVRLELIPPFQSEDLYLKTIDESFLPLYELLNDEIGESEYECTIQ